MSATVYFSRTITPEKVLELYKLAGKELTGKVAVKVHSGEKGNQNFLRPDFWKSVIDHVGGTVVECNTAYEGARNTTERHRKLFAEHGWLQYFPVDLLDAEGPDLELEIPNGKVIQKNFVGKDIVNYDSMLVLSHFKGHPMGGYGGALKQLSIGVASSFGKAYIHGAGEPKHIWSADHDSFLEAIFTRFPRLAERRNQIAGTLSGGEQQMLAMGRAIMCHPKLLMLDEPSMGLSPLLVDQVFEIIKDINKDGTTVLLVEQNAGKSLAISDRAYVMENGSIVLSGTGAELAASEQVRKAYLGG